MKFLVPWLGALLLAFPNTGLAVPDGQNKPTTGESDSIQGDPTALAGVLNPAEQLIALAGRGFDQAFDKGLAAEGGADEMDKEHPGFIAELRRTIREITLADLRADIPNIHQCYARFFAERFTPEELAELLAFYRSPAGARIIQAKYANIDLSGMTDRLATDPDAKISAGDVQTVGEQAQGGILKDMSAEDFQALLQFGLKPVARKLKDAGPELAGIEAEIANQPDPALDAAIEAATNKIYERYGLAATADR